MLRLYLIILFAALVSAANKLTIANKCPYDLYHWAVGPPDSGLDGYDNDRIRVPANTTISSDLIVTEELGAGISHKVRDLPVYWDKPAGVIQLEYHNEPSTNALWYDFSVIDCDMAHGADSPMYCPFLAGGVKMHVPADPKCKVAECKGGKCSNTYEKPGSWKGEPSWRCRRGVDLVVEFCTEGPGQRTFGDKPEYTEQPEVTVPEEELTVSPNGACGSKHKYTCEHSKWGQCCSEYGYCGATEAYCGNGCQGTFGLCRQQQVISSSTSSSSEVYAEKKTSTVSSSVKALSMAKMTSTSASRLAITVTQTITQTVSVPVPTTVTVYGNGTACGNQTYVATSLSSSSSSASTSPEASTTAKGMFKKWVNKYGHGHGHGHGR